MSSKMEMLSCSASMSKAAEKSRIGIIDALRGIAIIAMLFHHFALDLELLLEPTVKIPILNWPVFPYIQLIFVTLFLLISGVCSHFSRNNIRRGLIVLAAALAVSLATFIATPDEPVYFGILHMLGSCMLIYGVFKKGIDKLPALPSAAFYLTLFVVCYIFYVSMPRIDIPHLYILGLPDHRFASADYYPLFPWLFLFLFGAVLGRPVKERQLPAKFYNIKIPFFEAVGRHTLLIYVLHQPIFLGLIILFKHLFLKS